MPPPEVKPAPLRDTNYQNKIIEPIDFNKKKTDIIMMHNHPYRAINLLI